MGISPAELWEMDPEQVDLMVAYVEVENDAGPHGVPMSEATDPRANPTYYGEGARRYEVEMVPDWVQYAINMERKKMQDQDEKADLSHFRAVVERVDY